jgi:hypothetical protein
MVLFGVVFVLAFFFVFSPLALLLDTWREAHLVRPSRDTEEQVGAEKQSFLGLFLNFFVFFLFSLFCFLFCLLLTC